MAVTHIIVEQAIGATRAVAFNADDMPVSLYLDLWSLRDRQAKLGRVHTARIRSLSRSQGGAFLELPNGEEVFLRVGDMSRLAIGTEMTVQIAAEARRGKLARVRGCDDAPVNGLSDLQEWQYSIVAGKSADIAEVQLGDVRIEAAFDKALSPQGILSGGGHLHIAETPALTTIDIDMAGRDETGRAGDRALKVNIDAAAEAARQLSLRGLGGLAVLDCIAPLQKRTADQIKSAFLKQWRDVETRKAEILAPSPFGLMEIKLAWGRTPIGHLLTHKSGEFTAEAVALQGLRLLEREARALPMSRLVLNLPVTAYDWVNASGLDIQSHIDARFGARISIAPTDQTQPDVIKA